MADLNLLSPLRKINYFQTFLPATKLTNTSQPLHTASNFVQPEPLPDPQGCDHNQDGIYVHEHEAPSEQAHRMTRFLRQYSLLPADLFSATFYHPPYFGVPIISAFIMARIDQGVLLAIFQHMGDFYTWLSSQRKTTTYKTPTTFSEYLTVKYNVEHPHIDEELYPGEIHDPSLIEKQNLLLQTLGSKIGPSDNSLIVDRTADSDNQTIIIAADSAVSGGRLVNPTVTHHELQSSYKTLFNCPDHEYQEELISLSYSHELTHSLTTNYPNSPQLLDSFMLVLSLIKSDARFGKFYHIYPTLETQLAVDSKHLNPIAMHFPITTEYFLNDQKHMADTPSQLWSIADPIYHPHLVSSNEILPIFEWERFSTPVHTDRLTEHIENVSHHQSFLTSHGENWDLSRQIRTTGYSALFSSSSVYIPSPNLLKLLPYTQHYDQARGLKTGVAARRFALSVPDQNYAGGHNEPNQRNPQLDKLHTFYRNGSTLRPERTHPYEYLPLYSLSSGIELADIASRLDDSQNDGGLHGQNIFNYDTLPSNQRGKLKEFAASKQFHSFSPVLGKVYEIFTKQPISSRIIDNTIETGALLYSHPSLSSDPYLLRYLPRLKYLKLFYQKTKFDFCNSRDIFNQLNPTQIDSPTSLDFSNIPPLYVIQPQNPFIYPLIHQLPHSTPTPQSKAFGEFFPFFSIFCQFGKHFYGQSDMTLSRLFHIKTCCLFTSKLSSHYNRLFTSLHQSIVYQFYGNDNDNTQTGLVSMRPVKIGILIDIIKSFVVMFCHKQNNSTTCDLFPFLLFLTHFIVEILPITDPFIRPYFLSHLSAQATPTVNDSNNDEVMNTRWCRENGQLVELDDLLPPLIQFAADLTMYPNHFTAEYLIFQAEYGDLINTNPSQEEWCEILKEKNVGFLPCNSAENQTDFILEQIEAIYDLFDIFNFQYNSSIISYLIQFQDIYNIDIMMHLLQWTNEDELFLLNDMTSFPKVTQTIPTPPPSKRKRDKSVSTSKKEKKKKNSRPKSSKRKTKAAHSSSNDPQYDAKMSNQFPNIPSFFEKLPHLCPLVYSSSSTKFRPNFDSQPEMLKSFVDTYNFDPQISQFELPGDVLSSNQLLGVFLLSWFIQKQYPEAILMTFIRQDLINWDQCDIYGFTVLDHCLINQTWSYAPEFVSKVIEKTNCALKCSDLFNKTSQNCDEVNTMKSSMVKFLQLDDPSNSFSQTEIEIIKKRNEKWLAESFSVQIVQQFLESNFPHFNFDALFTSEYPSNKLTFISNPQSTYLYRLLTTISFDQTVPKSLLDALGSKTLFDLKNTFTTKLSSHLHVHFSVSDPTTVFTPFDFDSQPLPLPIFHPADHTNISVFDLIDANLITWPCLFEVFSGAKKCPFQPKTSESTPTQTPTTSPSISYPSVLHTTLPQQEFLFSLICYFLDHYSHPINRIGQSSERVPPAPDSSGKKNSQSTPALAQTTINSQQTLAHEYGYNQYSNKCLFLHQIDVIYVIYSIISHNFAPKFLHTLLTKYLHPNSHYQLFYFYELPPSLTTALAQNAETNGQNMLRTRLATTQHPFLSIDPILTKKKQYSSFDANYHHCIHLHIQKTNPHFQPKEKISPNQNYDKEESKKEPQFDLSHGVIYKTPFFPIPVKSSFNFEVSLYQDPHLFSSTDGLSYNQLLFHSSFPYFDPNHDVYHESSFDRAHPATIKSPVRRTVKRPHLFISFENSLHQTLNHPAFINNDAIGPTLNPIANNISPNLFDLVLIRPNYLAYTILLLQHARLDKFIYLNTPSPSVYMLGGTYLITILNNFFIELKNYFSFFHSIQFHQTPIPDMINLEKYSPLYHWAGMNPIQSVILLTSCLIPLFAPSWKDKVIPDKVKQETYITLETLKQAKSTKSTHDDWLMGTTKKKVANNSKSTKTSAPIAPIDEHDLLFPINQSGVLNCTDIFYNSVPAMVLVLHYHYPKIFPHQLFQQCCWNGINPNLLIPHPQTHLALWNFHVEKFQNFKQFYGRECNTTGVQDKHFQPLVLPNLGLGRPFNPNTAFSYESDSGYLHRLASNPPSIQLFSPPSTPSVYYKGGVQYISNRSDSVSLAGNPYEPLGYGGVFIQDVDLDPSQVSNMSRKAEMAMQSASADDPSQHVDKSILVTNLVRRGTSINPTKQRRGLKKDGNSTDDDSWALDIIDDNPNEDKNIKSNTKIVNHSPQQFINVGQGDTQSPYWSISHYMVFEALFQKVAYGLDYISSFRFPFVLDPSLINEQFQLHSTHIQHIIEPFLYPESMTCDPKIKFPKTLAQNTSNLSPEDILHYQVLRDFLLSLQHHALTTKPNQTYSLQISAPNLNILCNPIPMFAQLPSTQVTKDHNSHGGITALSTLEYLSAQNQNWEGTQDNHYHHLCTVLLQKQPESEGTIRYGWKNTPHYHKERGFTISTHIMHLILASLGTDRHSGKVEQFWFSNLKNSGSHNNNNNDGKSLLKNNQNVGICSEIFEFQHDRIKLVLPDACHAIGQPQRLLSLLKEKGHEPADLSNQIYSSTYSKQQLDSFSQIQLADKLTTLFEKNKLDDQIISQQLTPLHQYLPLRLIELLCLSGMSLVYEYKYRPINTEHLLLNQKSHTYTAVYTQLHKKETYLYNFISLGLFLGIQRRALALLTKMADLYPILIADNKNNKNTPQTTISPNHLVGYDIIYNQAVPMIDQLSATESDTSPYQIVQTNSQLPKHSPFQIIAMLNQKAQKLSEESLARALALSSNPKLKTLVETPLLPTTIIDKSSASTFVPQNWYYFQLDEINRRYEGVIRPIGSDKPVSKPQPTQPPSSKAPTKETKQTKQTVQKKPWQEPKLTDEEHVAKQLKQSGRGKAKGQQASAKYLQFAASAVTGTAGTQQSLQSQNKHSNRPKQVVSSMGGVKSTFSINFDADDMLTYESFEMTAEDYEEQVCAADDYFDDDDYDYDY
jgi:hypothetical protein